MCTITHAPPDSRWIRRTGNIKPGCGWTHPLNGKNRNRGEYETRLKMPQIQTWNWTAKKEWITYRNCYRPLRLIPQAGLTLAWRNRGYGVIQTRNIIFFLLYFEKEIENDTAIYGIDPIALNQLSGFDYFPNTWTQTPALQTIKFAFGTQNDPINGQKIMYLENPVAIYPSTIHSMIRSQRGCFTLHGNDKRDWEEILGQELSRKRRLVKYIIPKEIIPSILKDLYGIGITHATLFQDLDGLSRDLKYQFAIKGCWSLKVYMESKNRWTSPFNIDFGVDAFSLPSVAARAQLK